MGDEISQRISFLSGRIPWLTPSQLLYDAGSTLLRCPQSPFLRFLDARGLAMMKILPNYLLLSLM